MSGQSLSPDDYRRARRVLMRRDPILGAVIRTVGECGLAEVQHPDRLHRLHSRCKHFICITLTKRFDLVLEIVGHHVQRFFFVVDVFATFIV